MMSVRNAEPKTSSMVTVMKSTVDLSLIEPVRRAS